MDLESWPYWEVAIPASLSAGAYIVVALIRSYRSIKLLKLGNAEAGRQRDEELERLRIEIAEGHKREEELQSVVDWYVDFEKLGPLIAKLVWLCDESEVSRVHFFVASNGIDVPTRTSSVFEYRQDSEKRGKYFYRKIPLDPHYQAMIKRMEREGSYTFNTESEPDCMLRTHYLAEGVNESVVSHISTSSPNAKGRVNIRYFSYATDVADHISAITRLRFEELKFAIQEAAG